MLRAQSALERGDTSDAVEILERGLKTEGDPELLACKGMLATALIHSGQADRHLPLHKELMASNPTTPEE